jgi:elongation factor Ts
MVSASEIKNLREMTGAGMLDCKKALEESSGNQEEAVEWLRKKGLSKAAKKSDRSATEGLVQSYIHGEGRIGVLIEVNSETDFVARNDEFKTFVSDICMHIAATGPKYVSQNEISPEEIEKEKNVLRGKAIEEGKKPEFLEKILEGQLKKWAAEICLLDQQYVKNPEISVSDYLTKTIAKIGENLVIRRFSRFELGEGLEKKVNNFAEEVAAASNLNS